MVAVHFMTVLMLCSIMCQSSFPLLSKIISTFFLQEETISIYIYMTQILQKVTKGNLQKSMPADCQWAMTGKTLHNILAKNLV